MTREEVTCTHGMYIIERTGQDEIGTSDLVMVRGMLFLAVVPGTEMLSLEIRFEGRKYILGESLNSDWGHYDSVRKMRCRGADIVKAKTWKEAEKIQREKFMQIMEELEQAVKTRKEALENA